VCPVPAFSPIGTRSTRRKWFPFIPPLTREGVSERVWVQRLVDTGPPRRLFAGIENGFTSDRTSWFPAGEEPVRGPFPSPLSGQHLAKRVGKHRLAVFVSFAAANPDDFACAVEIADFKVRGLGDPESRAVHDGQNGSVAEVPRGFEQRFDLFPARNDRQLLFVAGQRNAVDIDLLMQGVAVKKTKSRDGLDVRRELHFLLVQQEDLISLLSG